MVVQSHIRVRYADTDAMGVVYHAKYLEYFEVGRGDWMRYHGLPYAEFEQAGLFVPAVECHCRWRAPAKYDDILTVETRVEDLTPAKVVFAYRVVRNPDGRLLCDGRTVHAFVDFSGRPQALSKKVPHLYERIQTVAETERAAGAAQ